MTAEDEYYDWDLHNPEEPTKDCNGCWKTEEDCICDRDPNDYL